MLRRLLTTFRTANTTHRFPTRRNGATRLWGELLEDRNLLAAEISVVDNSGAVGDASIAFTTLLADASESEFVRPGLPDDRHHIDVTNSGDAPLTLSEIVVNPFFESDIDVFDVTLDIPLTSDPGDDIVLAPGATQRFVLTFSPSFPNNIDPSNYDAVISDGLVIHSNAANDSTFEVSLTAKSTFRADVNYDGRVVFSELGILNATFGSGTGDPEYHLSLDIVADNSVNFADLGVLNLEFGRDINNPPPFSDDGSGGSSDEPKGGKSASSGNSASQGFQPSSSSSSSSFSAQSAFQSAPVIESDIWDEDAETLAEDIARLTADSNPPPADDQPATSSNSASDAVFEELGGSGESETDDGESDASLPVDDATLKSIL